MVEALLQRTDEVFRFLVGPDDFRHRRRPRRHRPAGGAGVMAGRFQDLLVPDVEPGRDVPDRLRQWQRGAILGHHPGQLRRGAGRQEAMVVVDEVDVAVVDPLVIGHVRIGRMDAHRLAEHLGHRPALAHQIVINFACPLLVARQDAILELLVERLAASARCVIAPCTSLGIRHTPVYVARPRAAGTPFTIAPTIGARQRRRAKPPGLSWLSCAVRMAAPIPVTPAEAGAQGERWIFCPWIPACAGTTIAGDRITGYPRT